MLENVTSSHVAKALLKFYGLYHFKKQRVTESFPEIYLCVQLGSLCPG